MNAAAGYLAILNITGFLLMGIDKYKAVHKHFRIPERVLFGAALLGGSFGAIAGMYLFRHKTRRLTFTAGMPLILIVQLIIFRFLLF